MRKLTIEEMEQRIKMRYPTENFKILVYTNTGSYGEIQCLNCQKIIKVNKFVNFFAKSKKFGCSECQSKNILKRKENLKELQKYYDIVETQVKEAHTYYTVKCKKCGHIRTTTLKNLIGHLKCGCESSCKRNRTAEEFIDEINKNSHNGKYSLVSSYINQSTKVLLQHECGFIWSVRPGDVIHGRTGCPKCNRKRSKGEQYISSILDQNQINYVTEKYLENSLQRFDFYLENNNHKIAIEYNGEQHYEQVKFFKSTLEEYQERDQRKKEYCLKNNIDLYIIPYTMSQEEILAKILEIINKFND